VVSAEDRALAARRASDGVLPGMSQSSSRSTARAFLRHADQLIELSEQQIIDQIAERLTAIYPTLSSDAVSRLVHEESARFHGRPVCDFVPLFVERYAKAELAKLGG
jgi:dGTP triphosphohydrolase